MPLLRTSAGFAALALAAILGLVPSAARAQAAPATPAPIGVSAFLSTLDDLDARVRQAPDADLAHLTEQWPAGWKVTVGEDVIDVSSAPLTTVTETGAERRQALRARLAAMRAEASRLT